MFGNFHSGNIERFCQGLGIAHLSREGFAIVGRAPGAGSGDIDRNRLIADTVERRMPKLERGGIDEGFKGRSSLSPSLGGTVECPGRARVAPADHGPHGALFVHHHNSHFRCGGL